MTHMLEQALSKLNELPEERQNAIASLILDEIKDETCWEESFTRSQKELKSLANEAMKEHEEGNTEKFDLDSL